MEIINKYYTSLIGVWLHFEEEMNKYTYPKDKEDVFTYRIATIKWFEFCCERTEDFFKKILEVKYGIRKSNAKHILQELLAVEFLTEREARKFIAMIHIRNNIHEAYKEEVAECIIGDCVKNFKDWHDTIKRCEDVI